MTGIASLRLDQTSRETVRRFALAVGVIVLLAAASAPTERWRVLATLFGFNGAVVAVIAAMLRERVAGPVLTRWDEVLGFLTLFFAVRMVGG
jgi:hypothetical protein